jgi:hypothetical protein
MRRAAWAALLAGLCAWPASPLPAAELLAGAASALLRVPAHTPLAGYSRRRGAPATGAHDPVAVHALVLRAPSNPRALAIISADLLIVDERLAEAVRRRLAAQRPGGVDVFLAATHTHSGPGAYGTRFLEKLSMGHFDASVVEAIVSAVAEAVGGADAAAVPARAVYGAGRVAGAAVNRMDPSGSAADRLTVCAFSPDAAGGQGRPFAILVGFGAHPTTLGAWNRAFSADYPGVLRRELAQRYPGATVLFFAGAVADQAPVKTGEGFEAAEQLGRRLAAAAGAALERAEPVALAPWRWRETALRLPRARVRVGGVTLPSWLGAALVDDDATLTVAAVGELALAGLPCDAADELGRRVEAEAAARGLRPRVAGFVNDYVGYCLPAARYRSDAYEARMAFNGPAAGEQMVEALIGLLDDVR